MHRDANIAVIIPALNEEHSIGRVLDDIPAWVDDVIVADNGCTDGTADVARRHGARVVLEPRRGYGSACLAAMKETRDPDVVVFLDADYSDHPEEMGGLVDPILNDEADLVIGSRVLGEREPGALTPQARFGNWLACRLLRAFWGVRYTDLGPFRAVRASTLSDLGMRDPDYGWTVEMQVRAARAGVRAVEVPVRYRRRIGRSKVSGTVRGVVGAGTKILAVIFTAAVRKPTGRPRPSAATGSERLILFTRFPQPGEVKTRLIPALGADGAADLHRRMANRAVELAKAWSSAAAGRAFEIRYAGGDRARMKTWLGEGHRLEPQAAGDLGERMRKALEGAWASGAERAVIIGSDCPALALRHLDAAFCSLRARDIVFGPACDGGYYLVGCRGAAPEIFADIPWGAAEVLSRSLRQAKAAEHTVFLLEELPDVDRPEDLSRRDNGLMDNSPFL